MKRFLLGILTGVILSTVAVTILFTNGVFSRIENIEDIEEIAYTYYYDGVKVPTSEENKGILYKDKIYVPIYYYSRMLDKNIGIDEKTKTITISSVADNYVSILTDPDRAPLQRTNFDFITKGMNGAEVRAKVGLPQNIYSSGSGLVIVVDRYSLDDGSVLEIFYGIARAQGVQSAFIIYPDGTTKSIIE